MLKILSRILNLIFLNINQKKESDRKLLTHFNEFWNKNQYKTCVKKFLCKSKSNCKLVTQ